MVVVRASRVVTWSDLIFVAGLLLMALAALGEYLGWWNDLGWALAGAGAAACALGALHAALRRGPSG